MTTHMKERRVLLTQQTLISSPDIRSLIYLIYDGGYKFNSPTLDPVTEKEEAHFMNFLFYQIGFLIFQ